MNKVLLVAISGFILAISSSSVLSECLILSNEPSGSIIIDDVFRELGERYEYRYNLYWDRWQVDDLEDFDAVFVAVRSGYSDSDVVRTLFEYTEDGGNLVWMGGTSANNDWVEVFNDYVEGDYNEVSPGGFELVNDEHCLATDLPDEYDWNEYNSILWYEIDDETFETVAVNNDSIPTLGVVHIDTIGAFYFIGYGLYYYYYQINEEEFDILQQIVFNILHTIDFKLNGMVVNATTHQPVQNVYVDLFLQENDALVCHDSTDSMGFYECSEPLRLGFTYYAVYYKDSYVTRIIRDIELDLCEDIEENVWLIPFLECDIEALHFIPIGCWVDVTGIVTIPTNTIDTEHTSFYIQDDTQYGIHIYGDDPWDAEMYGELNRGDEVRIMGQLDEYQGVAEINNIYLWEVISNGNPIPEPFTMNTGTMSNMQEMEGTWAHIEGYLQNDPPEHGNYTVILDDGSGDCWVRIIESTGIDLLEWEREDWLMIDGVIGLYEGDVRITPALQQDITRTRIDVPVYPRASLEEYEDGNNFGCKVNLKWEHTAFGEIDVLRHDGGPPFAYAAWIDNTMAVRFSPGDYCRLISVKYYLQIDDPGMFNVEVYNWDTNNNSPGDIILTREDTLVPYHYCGWHEFLIADENLTFVNDFVVGFGSTDFDHRLALNYYSNERSWSYDSGEWSIFEGSYYIRAVVQYLDGEIEEIEPVNSGDSELDSWISYNVYRNGELIRDGIDETSCLDTLYQIGYDEYTITAVYHEGESDHSEPVQIFFICAEDEISQQSLPDEWAITSIYPNPFNAVTNITVAVPENGITKIEIFNLLGQSVVVLHEGIIQPGYHHLRWHTEEPSGIYFLRFTSESGWNSTHKLLLMK
ncbi:MAG: T9SS type A sorting domain-containing protein [Candidatus Electryonea clarkiae]|nr:T9SS type A sorting domain-containing protein [Candidatus Electryonea clarkiae]MDP8288034.1 T9SS type A sorting domain-containing protein [Candidatus Electryonea clarkiae]